MELSNCMLVKYTDFMRQLENNKGVKIGLNHGSALDFFKDLNA